MKECPPNYWEDSYNKNILQRFWYNSRFKAIKKILKGLPNKSRILDVGCGSGFSMEKSIPKNKNFEIHGIDITENLISYAKNKRPNFHFKVACAEELPYKKKYFDAILYLDSIEHLINPKKSLCEAYRVLKDNGFVVVLVVKEHHPLFRIIWWLWTKSKGKVWNNKHLSIYDKDLLRRKMEETGFKVDKINKIHLGMSLIAVAYKIKGGL